MNACTVSCAAAESCLLISSDVLITVCKIIRPLFYVRWEWETLNTFNKADGLYTVFGRSVTRGPTLPEISYTSTEIL